MRLLAGYYGACNCGVVSYLALRCDAVVSCVLDVVLYLVFGLGCLL